MNDQSLHYDVIIIGGSYAGLSAAMALGRSRRTVLIIDEGRPCNRQTPHAHNLITHDGDAPADIARRAKEQVLAYPTVRFIRDKALSAAGADGAFEVGTASDHAYRAKKLLLATGVRDLTPPIPGFAECWGISVLHCPYCHGYEVRDEPLGVIANGDMGFEFTRLIHQWSRSLTLFTNGPSTLSDEQASGLASRGISIIEGEIRSIAHQSGQLSALVLQDGAEHPLKAVFAKIATEQHSSIAEDMGCILHEEGMFKGLIGVDDFGRTNVPGIFAAGDNTTPMRALAAAINAGTRAGAFINHDLVSTEF